MVNLDASRWVADYGDMLYRYAFPRVKDGDIAKDLVQETFLAAWRNHDNFKGEISEKNWLFTILKNKIIDHYRKNAKRVTESLPTATEKDEFFDGADHWTPEAAPKDWGGDQSRLVEQKEFLEVLHGCRKKLKPIHDHVFTMKYLDGLESEEICKELGITPSNYWVLIHRAKLHLRSCIEKNWFNK